MLILKILGVAIKYIGDIIEWVLYATLPNFCFIKSLEDLVTMHKFTKLCGGIDEGVCDLIRRSNETNLCCPGESYLLFVSAPKL